MSTERVRERDWVRGIVPRLQEELAAVDASLRVQDSHRLAYACEVRGYVGSETDNIHRTLYETDLLVSECSPGEAWKPRVVVEAKLRSVTTHDTITYSHKAAAHKQVHPYLRYGIHLGDRRHYPLPGRLFRHGAHFDFMVSWVGLEPTDLELRTLVELLQSEVEASRQLEQIIFDNRRRDRAVYTVLHRPLILRGALAQPPVRTAAPASKPDRPFAKYRPLRELLTGQMAKHRVQMTFAEIEVALGDRLPASAYEHRAWWSNQVDTTNRPQAAAWLGAGFAVESVVQEPGAGRVVFSRRGSP